MLMDWIIPANMHYNCIISIFYQRKVRPLIFGVLVVALAAIFLFFMKKRKSTVDILKEKISDIDFGEVKDSMHIVQVSDLHYIDSSLTDFGEAFRRKVEEPDGRMLRYIEQILDSFILEMIKKSPDVIVISGDLTYNGEKKSHEVLARKLQILRKKGIEILVIPGNHDIDNENAKKYSENSTSDTDSVTMEEFAKIYRDFGYDEENPRVIGRDKNSLSYMYMISPDKCLLMLETSCKKNRLEISNATFAWVQRMLNIAKNNNLSVISVTHENILAHNKMFIPGYKIENSSKLIDIYSEYNVRLNLSGHMHLQHVSENESVIDAALGCIALYPNLYANINIDGRNNIEYFTESLDVAMWASKYGWNDETLRNFKEKSKEQFNRVGKYQAMPVLDKLDITLEEKREMLDFMLKTNLAYFSGTIDRYDELSSENPIYQKWKKYCENTFLMSFINSIYMDNAKYHNSFRIDK